MLGDSMRTLVDQRSKRIKTDVTGGYRLEGRSVLATLPQRLMVLGPTAYRVTKSVLE